MTECPACCSKIVEPLYSAGPQPLMALNLPQSKRDAEHAALYPMNFYMCCLCGHVYNSDFDYAKIPYKEDSNRMYNNGAGWRAHLEDLAGKVRGGFDFSDKVIIDIGAGDGGFLATVGGRFAHCIAFEPGIDSAICRSRGIETYADYFLPQRDVEKFKPDVITCRHVLEHLQSPRDFVAEIAYYAQIYNVFPLFVAEVPCITKAMDTHRITDFLYEHVSNFTQRSLRVMFESAGWSTHSEYLTYNGEVAIWIGRPKREIAVSEFKAQAKAFRDHSWDSVMAVHAKIDTRIAQGSTIAFWGGTGKGAAFLNAYHLKNGIVVDSDLDKVGRYVPGTAQKIEHADALLESPVDMIVITTRWRAADIYAEIKRKGIKYKELLVLEESHLREYTEEMYNVEKA